MQRVLTAVVLIPLVLIILFMAPLWLFAVVIVIVALGAAEEYLVIAQKSGVVTFERLTYLVMILFFLATAGRTLINDRFNQLRNSPMGVQADEHKWLLHAYQSEVIIWLILLSTPAWFLLRGLRRAQLNTVLSGAGTSLFSICYIGLPLLGIFEVRSEPDGAALVLYMFLVVWCGDIAAYYVGRAIGRRKLAPGISPGKTWEGTIASLAASAIAGMLILVFADRFRAGLFALRLAPAGSVLGMSGTVWWVAVLCSLGINIAAQLGDLVESMLKRGAGVKDSGTLLPGHGGVLDRIDALLLAAPVLWYYSIFRLLSI